MDARTDGFIFLISVHFVENNITPAESMKKLKEQITTAAKKENISTENLPALFEEIEKMGVIGFKEKIEEIKEFHAMYQGDPKIKSMTNCLGQLRP